MRALFCAACCVILSATLEAHEDDVAHNADHHDASDYDASRFWYALGGTAVVTLGGNLSILVVMYFDMSKSALKLMTAFAVGGLLGDVFLHLLPHAATTGHSHHHEEHDHDHDHNHDHNEHHHHDHGLEELLPGLFILLGIFSFFIFEKYLRSKGHSGHEHAHGDVMTESSPRQSSKQETTKGRYNLRQRRKKRTELSDISGENEAKPDSQHGTVMPGAILNLAADTVHNFTDGIAIAAGFQTSWGVGKAMTLAVLLHEIPHEIGDFAVLVCQGFSIWNAFLAQFVSAVGAFAGCCFGMWVSTDPAYTLCFTAGGFIYISLVNILPGLHEDVSLLQTVMEMVCISAGVLMMVFIAVLEP